ncbi:ABC transporter substrate-binding protein [Sulfurimonas sp.]|uniref:Tgt2/MlaC family protein n=1 Tax=Sulfurimonas sp. TaxID=2022749 RepID=UPI00262D4741|nr:ABC transporter substrate-binding protein [Sulfurimonas sp.]MCW8894317.1 ABC transporter substrate-binding protein [Sulfurimonas sp.]MCW9067868.1 ABC transporter substrate-binding protein [Sulfurimonas sp.]
MKTILKKILFVSAMLIFTQSLGANEQDDVKERFLTNIDKVILIVEDKSLSKKQRNANIINVLTPMFDFELMAKLSLGKIWRTLDSEDQKKFVNLYVERMEKSYSSKVDSYNNEKVEVKKIEQPKDNRIALVTDLIGNDESLEIVYKYYKPKKPISQKDTWLVYDVEIKGVSILKADKAQFKEFLQTKSIHELMAVLVEK